MRFAYHILLNILFWLQQLGHCSIPNSFNVIHKVVTTLNYTRVKKKEFVVILLLGRSILELSLKRYYYYSNIARNPLL